MIRIKSPGSKFPEKPYELEFKEELPTEITLLPEAALAVKVVKTLTMFVDPERVMVPFFPFCPKLNPIERTRAVDKNNFIVYLCLIFAFPTRLILFT